MIAEAPRTAIQQDQREHFTEAIIEAPIEVDKLLKKGRGDFIWA
ncbi:hypothetical protein RISK_004187 [Rhodopirellula islandica]|uniref:Uncharacterized protein n=1 Tax=Rhodopirellula islandica TaxID=595434 RepID=A0A0J1BAP5_RHOIS|nr:hypothetical protein RISK_004187 [Rhodopirellula islandica]